MLPGIENYFMAASPACHTELLSNALGDRGYGPFIPYFGSRISKVISDEDNISLVEDPQRHIAIGLIQRSPVFWQFEWEVFRKYYQHLYHYIDTSEGWPETVWFLPYRTDAPYQACELFATMSPGGAYNFHTLYITLIYFARIRDFWEKFFAQHKIEPVRIKYPYTKTSMKDIFHALGEPGRVTGWQTLEAPENPTAQKMLARFMRELDRQGGELP